MNLQLDNKIVRRDESRRNLWSDNRVWWANCLALERYWSYGGTDLLVARSRRDAILKSIVEG
jgi:hypothetical protein